MTTKKPAKKKAAKRPASKTRQAKAAKATKPRKAKPRKAASGVAVKKADAAQGPGGTRPFAAREWLVFSDLHYSPKTKDRALAALAHMREQAVARSVDGVIFTGDFWDSRGALPVRLLVRLLAEFDLWRAAGIQVTMVPGNHDQVSKDGTIHGLSVLEPYENIRIATEPIYDGKLAFLPWREEPEEQAALFSELEGTDWAIFAHAEIGGAHTNHGFVAPGRVALSTIESKAFACYLGHYHLRQKHGDRTWYLGNPFELDYREVADPKGYAIITEGVVEPEFFEIPHMPRHLLWQVPEAWDGEHPTAILGAGDADFVRVHATADQFTDPRMIQFLDDYPQLQRITSKAEKSDEPPEFALSLSAAIDLLLEDVPKAERATYREVCDGILSEIPQLPRPDATNVELLSVEIRDFASISGTVRVSLSKGTFALITGQIGSGKTSIIDAITWALFGQTSPRKAGSDSAVMRGDEVINDNASSCHAHVMIRTPAGEFEIQRTKSRGSGAKVSVHAYHDQEIPVIDGIADTNDWIRVMLGYDYALWRASVSLGQGAVGNFVTNSDKARKELLSDSLGLSVCKPARAQAKKLSKALDGQLDTAKSQRTSAAAKLEALADYDFDEMIQIWERSRQDRLVATQTLLDSQQAKVAACDTQLESRPQWEAARDQLAKSQADLAGELRPAESALQQAQLSRTRAALQVNHAREGQMRVADELSRLRKAKTPLCPTCGTEMGEEAAATALEKAEASLIGADELYDSATTAETNAEAAVTTAEETLIAASAAAAEKKERYTAQSTAIASAMQTFAKLEANRNTAALAVQQSTELLARLTHEANPHTSQAEQHTKRKAGLAELLSTAQTTIEDLELRRAILDFWADAFGPRRLPVLALRPVLYSLQESANYYLTQLVEGRLSVQLSMTDDALDLEIYERCPDGDLRERRYEQLSGGMRRCVELAFSPFALGDFARQHLGRRIDYIAVDELTAGLGAEEKRRAVAMLRAQGIGRVLVVDHDPEIQGAFDEMYRLTRGATGATVLTRI